MYRLYLFMLAAFLLTACGTEPAENTEEKTTEANASLEEINQQILDNPNDDALYHQRALLYMEAKDLEAALADVERSLKLDSSQTDYYITQSNIYFVTNQTRMAKEALEKCLSIDPEHVEGLLKLAEILLYVKKYEESIALIDQALKKDQFNAKAYFMKGMNFKELGDTAKAVSSMQTAVEQDPDYYNAFIQLGVLYATMGDATAVMYYDNALKIQPQSIEALYNKGKFLQDVGEWEAAMATYDVILKIDAENKNAHYNKGVVTMIGLEEYTKAIPYFNKVLELDPKSYQAYYSRGTCYQATGKDGLARQDYEMALQVNPSFTPAAQSLNAMQ